MKIVYHKHNSSNSYWDNYSYDEDWYLCDSEEEYQAKLEEYRKKYEEDKNNSNFKKYPCYMPCFYDEGKMHASEYYYAHEWTGKNFDCFGFSYLRKFERGQRHEHFIKPGSIGDIAMADNSHCAGWMYGSWKYNDMALTERDLAEWIMQDRGQKYVDLAGSDTIDATKIIEIHKQDCIEKRFSDLVTKVECRAIRNWVAGAGYIDGKYVYLLYNTKNNTIN